MTFPTEEEHAAAVIAALKAANAAPYDLDEIPSTLPTYYTEVTVTRRFGGVQRNSAQTGTQSYRITTRAVAKTVSNAREMRKRTQAALNEARLTIGGRTSTPIQFETEDVIGPDDGYYSGLTAWTYVI